MTDCLDYSTVTKSFMFFQILATFILGVIIFSREGGKIPGILILLLAGTLLYVDIKVVCHNPPNIQSEIREFMHKERDF